MKKYILVLLTLTILSCKDKKTIESTTTKTEQQEHADEIHISKQQFDGSKMLLGTLSKQNFPEIVKATGMIDVPPQSKEIITSFFGGFIKKSNLLIGDKVKKGQALVSIENPEFVDMQQEYLEIKETLEFLKNEYERQKTLFDEKITSKKKYLKAQSDYNREKAKYNGLKKKLQMLNINVSAVESGIITSTITLFSSINGTVTKTNVSKGTPISPADEIMEITNTDHIHIELVVFEKDAMKIKKDQEINFRIPEASTKNYNAEVHLVGKSIDEKTRTIKVHGHLHDETKNTFDIGMFVEAEISVAKKKVMALPETAFIESDEHFVVLKLESSTDGNFTFELVEVKKGKTYRGFTELLSNAIKPTDKILVKGGYSLIGGEGGGHSH